MTKKSQIEDEELKQFMLNEIEGEDNFFKCVLYPKCRSRLCRACIFREDDRFDVQCNSFCNYKETIKVKVITKKEYEKLREDDRIRFLDEDKQDEDKQDEKDEDKQDEKVRATLHGL